MFWRQGDSITLNGKVQSLPLQDFHSYRGEKKDIADPSASAQWSQQYIYQLNGLFMFIALPVNEAKQSSEEYGPF